jgi:outer membrane protein assembly factor BamB
VNGDGIDDIVIAGDYTLYALSGNNGTALWTFTPPTLQNHFLMAIPVITDLNNDSIPEVIIGNDDSSLYALYGINGSVFWKYSFNNGIQSSPALGDLTHDGFIDVIVGGVDRNLYALHGINGTLIWSVTFKGWIYASPVLAYVNNDEDLDVLIADWDGTVSAVSGKEGIILWHYYVGPRTDFWKSPSSVSDFWSSPSLADLDNDEKLEVVIGGTSDRYIHALNIEDGSVLWRYYQNTGTYSTPSIADINGDGRLEMLIGNWANKLLSLHGENGNLNWEYEVDNGIVSSPIVGDINNDFKVDIVFGCQNGMLYALTTEKNIGRIEWQALSGITFDRPKNYLDVDQDNDFLSDVPESILKTDLINNDTDTDEIPDGWEVFYGLDPLNSSDSALDIDQDGLNNSQEYLQKAHPHSSEKTVQFVSTLPLLFALIIFCAIRTRTRSKRQINRKNLPK